MAVVEEPEDRCAELVSAIRGSCEWCARAVHAMHLCELTVLAGVAAPLRFGVGEDSRYEQPPLILGKPGTILMRCDLVKEESNPAPKRRAKVTGFACVLAHEMAHHALTHNWRVFSRFADVSELALEDRRKALAILEAAALAKRTGLPYDVIVNHWGISDAAMQARLVEIAAEQSDEYVLRAPADESRTALRLAPHEAQIEVAEEWGAAVVGCMMSYRLTKGPSFAAQMARSVLEALPSSVQSTLVETILMAACQNPEAETLAIRTAIATLETAYSNPDIRDCEERLHESNRDWAFLFSAEDSSGIPT